MVSVKGEKRVRINEMGAGKEYGERDWEKEKKGGSKERKGGERESKKGKRRGK